MNAEIVVWIIPSIFIGAALIALFICNLIRWIRENDVKDYGYLSF